MSEDRQCGLGSSSASEQMDLEVSTRAAVGLAPGSSCEHPGTLTRAGSWPVALVPEALKRGAWKEVGLCTLSSWAPSSLVLCRETLAPPHGFLPSTAVHGPRVRMSVLGPGPLPGLAHVYAPNSC